VADAIQSRNSFVYEFSVLSMDGREVSLAQYKGQVMLIVNTASKCGFTPQYAELEALYRQYKDRGFVILAFPCNQFGAQEPGSSADIARFCEQNYQVSFPVFAKIDVNGAAAHPLYKFLKKERSGLLGALGWGAIKWNFTKFLVDCDGKVVGRYAPSTTPPQLTPEIDKLLQ